MKKDAVIQKGKYLKLVIRDGWEYIERVNCSGVVIIVGKTDEDKLILVEQFRRPVGKHVIGFPAGLAGDERGKRGESLVSAAKRELIEETGYSARRMSKFFEGPVSAGMCRDKVTFFHASGLEKVGVGGGVDDLEQIKVHTIAMSRVDGWLKRQVQKGLLVGPNVFAGLYFLKHWVKSERRFK
ncbi:MAG: NUDIX hydrolase [Candidatus Omnitrophota bacterium]